MVVSMYIVFCLQAGQALWQATVKGDYTAVSVALGKADPNWKNEEWHVSKTVKTMHGWSGWPKMKCRFDQNISHSPQGYTALHAAILHGHEEIVELLLSRGGNPNIPSKVSM